MERNFWISCRMVLIREMSRIVSRPVYAVITILIPLLCFGFFATFMPDGLPCELPVGIIDHDNSMLSRNLIRQIEATPECKVTGHYLNFNEAREAMQSGDIYGFTEIPADIEKMVLSGQQPVIRFYYNQTYMIAGSLVLKDMSLVLNTVSAGLNLKGRMARGQGKNMALAAVMPIIPEIHAIGNPFVNYSVYLINVIMPGLLQLMVLLTTVYIIGVELKESSSRVWLKTGGNRIIPSLSGKLLPYTLIFCVMGFVMDVILFKILRYPLHTGFGWMVLNTFLMILSAQAVGILMIGVFPVLRDGLSFAGLYGMLAFSYSGLSFPIEGMPGLLQGLSYLFPLRYYFIIYQKLALNGFPPITAFTAFASMLVFLLLPGIVAIRLKKAMFYMDYPRK